ncbi:trypco2 family protein [Kibdelosporangium lantanae]|uniref:Trypco2 family protein n=1 Tax=Kibdelosporangium lantanae TaxID=1497396 RepID=A0ABW3M2Q7_9PSEU
MTNDAAGWIELAEWIAALRSELQAAQNEGTGKDLQFVVGPLELEFEVTASREAGGKGGVKFWVAEVGSDVRTKSGTTQRVKMTLTPHSGDGDVKVSDRL